MNRLALFLFGSIPVIIALLIVIPQITRPEIPITAATSNDEISIEYSKQYLKKIVFGVTESVGAQKTELLSIQNDGKVVYSVTKNGYPDPDINTTLEKTKLKKLTALIKETGFMQIPKDSFAVKSDASEFTKYGIKVTLNGKFRNVQWAEQNASEEFIPPLIGEVQSQLDGIISEIIE